MASQSYVHSIVGRFEGSAKKPGTSNAWETEDDPQAALQTPTDTPRRTPSRSSRPSRSLNRSGNPSVLSLSPAGYRNDDSTQAPKDITTDESISILDPRRFTPSLHANLVSEILTLRRDQEGKVRLIEDLEAQLLRLRNEAEEFVVKRTVTEQETRALKRQLALLEGGSSAAVSDLEKERNGILEGAAETRRRLDAAVKKSRAQEEDVNRTNDLWARDRDTWEEEKRKLERKVHVAETRLRGVLDEVAAYQADQQMEAEEFKEEGDDIGNGSDVGSIRSPSRANPSRMSMLSDNMGSPRKPVGVSLADELNFEEMDFEDDETDIDGRQSVLSQRDSLASPFHTRNQSRDSMMLKLHRRNQSVDSQKRPGSVLHGRTLQQNLLNRLEGGIFEADETPPSPQFCVVMLPGLSIEPIVEPARTTRGTSQSVPELEIEANQSRKRSPSSSAGITQLVHKCQMVSSGSQTTMEEPLSPPRTPKSPTLTSRTVLHVEPPNIEKLEMISTFTQTEPVEVTRKLPAPLSIPSISVHPPTSGPTTPRLALLPQHSKDAGCQASRPYSANTASVGIQTESIRVDERLPKHLQPSTISSSPPSPDVSNVDVGITQAPPPPRNPRRVDSQRSASVSPEPEPAVKNAYPGENDDGPVSEQTKDVKRPYRISSLFAGFNEIESSEEDNASGDENSGNENGFTTPLSMRPKMSDVRIKHGSRPTTPQIEHSVIDRMKSKQTNSICDSKGQFMLQDPPALRPNRQSPRANPNSGLDRSPIVNTARQGTMRRAALIQNGITAHQDQTRRESGIQPPPFPIPTRASSRKPAFSASAPSDGQRSPTPWDRRAVTKNVNRSGSFRKARSTAALASGRHQRQLGRQGQPSPSVGSPGSSRPPMPMNDITSPYRDPRTPVRQDARHRNQPSVSTALSSTAETIEDTNAAATSVVDAIAQTMVGEWMFKYVRRRKSFGVTEKDNESENLVNGVRHRRWVWLAPYERAVMWSSKQPTTGSALLGKSGRKLNIQSVLDVKDDNPVPKGQASIFNRSVLILTPSRALKFTASTQERHYIWLTALSFLAHSNQSVPDVISPPVVFQDVGHRGTDSFDMPNIPQKSNMRNRSIRDSIRITKTKTMTPAVSMPTISVQDKQFRHGRSSAMSGPMDNSFTAAHDFAIATNENNEDFWRDTRPAIFESPTAAAPLDVDRSQFHGRKRSNTGNMGRVPPPLSFRGLSDRTSSRGLISSDRETFSTATDSISHGGHSTQQSITNSLSVNRGDMYQNPGFISQRSSSYGAPAWTNAGNMSVNNLHGISSGRTSEASYRSPPGGFGDGGTSPGRSPGGNFFDAVGTVRMEAFISPLAKPIGRPREGSVDEEKLEIFGAAKRRSRDLGGFYSMVSGGGMNSRGGGGAGAGAGGSRRQMFGREKRVTRDVFSGTGEDGYKTAGEEEFRYRGRDDPFNGF